MDTRFRGYDVLTKGGCYPVGDVIDSDHAIVDLRVLGAGFLGAEELQPQHRRERGSEAVNGILTSDPRPSWASVRRRWV